MSKLRGGVLCGAGIMALANASPAMAQCDDVLPSASPSSAIKRDVTARDLIELRDIGSPVAAAWDKPSPLAKSPDGRSIAFITSRADLASDGYCRSLMVLATAGSSTPRTIDRGGDIVTISQSLRGLRVESGSVRTIVPQWSPDGTRLLYLRRDTGVTRAWVARVDGGGAQPVTPEQVEIEVAAWSADGLRIVYGTEKGIPEQREAIEREGLTGWLYDNRFMPDIGARPVLAANPELKIRALDANTLEPLEPGSQDLAMLLTARQYERSPDPQDSGGGGGKRNAAYLVRSDKSPLAPSRLVYSKAGDLLECNLKACIGAIAGIWLDGVDVLFLRREDWARGTLVLYRWRPGTSRVQAILRTDDVLHGCIKVHAELICTREASTMPRRIVALDLRTGRQRVMFDPNPQFDGIRLGRVTRLRFRNELGLEAWGDLVLPPGYKPAKKLPLVVVQYHSDGFLRGGTGDEYPIFLFARRGMAVLSMERPATYASAFPQLASWYDINAANQKNWAERRSQLSAVLTGVHEAVALGAIDPAKVGITGLSDGATTVAFGLINARVFAVAAISTCCVEPNTTATYGGPGWAAWLRGMGYPPASGNNILFWRDMSLARNAGKIDTPLLMQLADSEYLLSLEAYGALHELGRPVEMHVFPGEHHTKVQPVHRRAIYERNVDWFDFWLTGRTDPDPAKAAQYARWLELRKQRAAAAAAMN